MSLMTAIAAVIRNKLNSMTDLISGKADLGHTHVLSEVDVTEGQELNSAHNYYVGMGNGQIGIHEWPAIESGDLPSHTHEPADINGLIGASKYVGTDASGNRGVFPLPSGSGPVVMFGTHDSNGSRVAGTVVFSRLGIGYYRASLADFGFTVTLNNSKYYINNGSIVFTAELKPLLCNTYCDQAYVYLRTSNAGMDMDIAFNWIAVRN